MEIQGLTPIDTKHDSNITAFSYNRWSPQVELGINALTF
jgi:hypothetical protein